MAEQNSRQAVEAAQKLSISFGRRRIALMSWRLRSRRTVTEPSAQSTGSTRSIRKLKTASCGRKGDVRCPDYGAGRFLGSSCRAELAFARSSAPESEEAADLAKRFVAPLKTLNRFFRNAARPYQRSRRGGSCDRWLA